MKICDVRTYLLRAELSEGEVFASSKAMLVEVVSDEGLSGFVEAYGPAPASSLACP